MIVVIASAGAARICRYYLPGPHKISVAIDSQPRGASVFVDNRHAGITPILALPVWPGQHSVRLEKYGFRRWSRGVPFSEDFPVLRVRLRSAACGTVWVLSEPAQCEVYLDGRRRGVSPIRLDDATTGPHELRITRTGFMPNTQQIMVPPAREVKVSIKLESKTEEYLLAQLRRNPKDLLSYVELLHIYLINGKLDKARASLVAVLRLWSTEGTDSDTAARLEQEVRKAYFAEYNLGGDAALDPVRAAIEAGMEEVAFTPPQGGSAQVGLLLARLLEAGEKLDKARGIYERCLAKWSGDVDVKRAYGLLLCRLQRIPEAVKALEEVVAARPADAQAHMALAQAYMGQNKTEDTLRVLLHGAEIAGVPPAEKIWFETQLAGVYHAQSKFAQAAERWEKAWPVSENADQQAELQMAAAMEHNLAGNKNRGKELYTSVLNGGAAAGLKERAKTALAQ
jgi:tetratricopeptide (TPR) repeat protein